MGQKSDAVFAGMHFIKYFDATQNETFLRNRAYPFLREVIDFYESYMTKNASTGRFDVLNSCAMENCGEQDLDSTTASSKCTAAGPLCVFPSFRVLLFSPIPLLHVQTTRPST